MLDHFFNRKDRLLDCPIVLNPKTMTFEDVKLHAELRQRLQPSTIDKRLRYARFMQNHKIPIDFHNPDYIDFIRHMDYRERVEQATPEALNHEWKVMQMFLRAYHIEKWHYKPPSQPPPPMRILPFPEVVHNFFYFRYSKNAYEERLYQYIFFFGFMIGVRVPSELIEMKVGDVIFEDNDRAYLTITETKKHKSKRMLIPERTIMTSTTSKSLKNWIDHWRPKVVDQYSGDALFLRPDGAPFTSACLRHKLSDHGKKIWRHFRPYDMRHWCAVARLIRSKIDTGFFDCYSVKNWLGHEKMSTTEVYIKYAEQYYRELPVDWISYACRNRIAGSFSSSKNRDEHTR